MAIAGVEPVAFATSELGSMRYAMTSLTNNSMEPISLPSGTQLFTDEQVCEILIKFINGIELDDLNSIKIMYENGLNNTAKLIETDIIDEFMESGK